MSGPIDLLTGSNAADVVFVVDESGSMNEEHDWIGSVIDDIDFKLRQRGVGGTTQSTQSTNRYGLVGVRGFGNSPVVIRGIPMDTTGNLFGTAQQFLSATQQLHAFEGTAEPMYAGIEQLLFGTNYLNVPPVNTINYNFRSNAARFMILVTDDGRYDYINEGEHEQRLNSIVDRLNSPSNPISFVGVLDATYTANDGNGNISGYDIDISKWTISSTSLVTAPTNNQDVVMALSRLPSQLGRYPFDAKESWETKFSIAGAGNPSPSNAIFVFDWENQDNYKYVSVLEDINTFEISEVVNGVKQPRPINEIVDIWNSLLAKKTIDLLDKNVSYTVKVTVSLGLDAFGQRLVEADLSGGNLPQAIEIRRLFPASDNLLDGRLGMGAWGSIVEFDSVRRMAQNQEAFHSNQVYYSQDFGLTGFSPSLGVTYGGSGLNESVPTAYLTNTQETGYVAASPFSLAGAGNDVGRDYLSIASATNGSVWDIRFISQANVNPSIATLFATAFAESIANEAAGSGLLTTLQADSESLNDIQRNGRSSFVVKFRGSGRAESFSLKFVDSSNAIRGEIPVRIHAAYQYDLRAIDPDGDAVSFEWMPGTPTHGATLVDGRVRWNPTSPGEYSFSVRALDGKGGVDVQSWTVTVTNQTPGSNLAPTIESATGLKAEENRRFEFQVCATDPNADTLRYFLESNVPGMAIDRNTGMVSWIPPFGTAASTQPVSFIVRVSDGRVGGEATRTFQVQVAPFTPTNQSPIITSEPLTTIAVSQLYRYDVTAQDSDFDFITYSFADAPSGMGIDSDNGIISWRPTTNQVGTHSVTVVARDGRGAVGQQRFSVQVVSAQNAPVIESIPLLTFRASEAGSYGVKATDPNGDLLSYYLVGEYVPAGVSINATSGLLSWPSPTVGQYRFGVGVRDSRGATAQTEATIRVVAANAPVAPRITSTPVELVSLTGNYAYNVVANQSNVVFSIDDRARAVGFQINTSTGALTWLPREVGEFPVTVRVTSTSTSLETTQFFTVRVFDPSSMAPIEILSTPPMPAAIGLLYTYQVNARDPDGSGTLQYQLINAPAGMQISAAGKLTWTPAPGTPDVTKIRLRVFDNSTPTQPKEALQSFDLPVLANTPPVFTSVPGLFKLNNETYIYNATATDVNDFGSLTFTLLSAYPGLSMTPNGELSWNLLTSETTPGIYPISIAVADGLKERSVQGWELRVQGVGANSPPTIEARPRGVLEAGDLLLHQVKAFDANFQLLTYSLDSVPAPPDGLSIDTQGLVTWRTTATHVNDPSTPHRYKVVVSDGIASASQTFELDVVRSYVANRPPSIDSVPVTSAVIGQDYLYQARATDPESSLLRWSLERAPRGMSVDAASGTLRWRPDFVQLGANAVTLRVTDDQGASGIQTFSVEARGVDLPPVFRSSPPVLAFAQSIYQTKIDAYDPEGKPLTFTISADGTNPVPSGLRVEGDRLIWSNINEGLTARFLLNASDGANSTALPVIISVVPGIFNRPPVITSAIPRVIVSGRPFTFVFDANDPDGPGSVITFSNPSVIDTNGNPLGNPTITSSGQFQWNPPPGYTGGATLSVTFTDGGPLLVYRIPVTLIASNSAPSLAPLPPIDVLEGTPIVYFAGVFASDADGHRLRFSLANAPSGWTINDLGVIQADSSSVVAGTYALVVKVMDIVGDSDQETLNVMVREDNVAPRVTLSASPRSVRQGDIVTFVLTARDEGEIKDLTLELTFPNNVTKSYSVDRSGRISIPMSEAAGSYSARGKALDYGANTGYSQVINLVVTDPSAPRPSIQIGSPTGNNVIREPVQVLGQITRPAGATGNMSYTVSLTRSDAQESQPIILAQGETLGNITGVLSGNNSIDPRSLSNGTYRLEVSARIGLGEITTETRQLNIESEAKIGNFTLSNVDLQINVGQVPLTIQRTYDSIRAAEKGEFGYGWKIELARTSLRTDLVPGAEYALGEYPAFRVTAHSKLTLF